jgi:RNA polymerase sigma-70 factor (ECF subfamily)
MNVADRNSALFSAICRTESSFVARVLKTCGVPFRDLADVAQDVLLAVWCQFADYDETRPIRPWLYCFAVRVARSHDAPSTENMIITEQDKRIALEAIERLPLGFRTVVMMHAEGMTMPQIAVALGMPTHTGFTGLRRALELARRYVYLAHAKEARQNATKKKRHVDHRSGRQTYQPHSQAARADTGTCRRAGRRRSGKPQGPPFQYRTRTCRSHSSDATFPEESKHQALIERTRFMSVAEVDELLTSSHPERRKPV